ncbi:hypothetical protein P4S72_27785 [Vibrio sp. PP-XX7]
MLVGGAVSFTGLGQLEQPEFTLKTALVILIIPEQALSKLKK